MPSPIRIEEDEEEFVGGGGKSTFDDDDGKISKVSAYFAMDGRG